MTPTQWLDNYEQAKATRGVMAGWSREGWMDELRRKIEACDPNHQREADDMREWLKELEAVKA